MKIIIAGSGCPKCKATEENVFEACAKLGLPADIQHIYDLKEIAKRGVMITPAVLIDGKVVIKGKVPTVEELMKILEKYKS